MVKKVADIGLLPQPIASIEQQRHYIAARNKKWGALVKSLGLEGSQ